MSESNFEMVEGSGNVFQDLGDPDADLKQAKAILAARIIAVLDERGLSLREVAAMTRFAAADFSRVRNADLGRFTLDRLMRMLASLDADLRVTLHVYTRVCMTAVKTQLEEVPMLSLKDAKDCAPNSVGVYVLYLDEEPKYVGRAIEDRPGQYTKGLRKRIQEHARGAVNSKDQIGRHRESLRVKMVVCETSREATNLEAALISELETVKNGWNVHSEGSSPTYSRRGAITA